jgi:hypothetical protein
MPLSKLNFLTKTRYRKHSQTMQRQRTQGNFLFEIFSNAKESTKVLLKERLNDLTKSQKDEFGNAPKDNWENFQRTQTHVNKKSGYDAEIIGVCVQTLITDVLIQTNGSLTDIQKLYAFWAEIKEEISIESMV